MVGKSRGCGFSLGHCVLTISHISVGLKGLPRSCLWHSRGGDAPQPPHSPLHQLSLKDSAVSEAVGKASMENVEAEEDGVSVT